MAYTVPNIVLDGAQEDISSLVYNFVSSNDLRFRNFLKIWKENHFCYIFSGRTFIKEVKYFQRELLILAKKYTSVKNYDGERIAGVYLMYALYYAQALKIPVRIRINKYDFGDLLQFVKEATEKDVKLLFYRLFVDHAFDFIYSDKLYSLERIRDRDLDLKNKKGLIKRGNVSTKEQMESLWKTIDFDHKSWLERESEYNRKKAILNSHFGGESTLNTTEFLKPLLTIGEELSSAKDSKRAGSKPGPSRLGDASATSKRKRVRSAFQVLEEGPSSSEEEALGGVDSMPHLLEESEEEVDPLAGLPIEI